jgi:hypothetical protein
MQRIVGWLINALCIPASETAAQIDNLFSYGGFRIETATWIQKWFKMSVGASRKL